jgi:hypothetical protein
MLPPADILANPEGTILDNKMDFVLSLLFKQTKQLTLCKEKKATRENNHKSPESIC